MPVFIVLQTAFSLFMLVHAAKRGAPMHWWMIILMPFGEWAYFFAVYLPSRNASTALARPFKAFSERPPTLDVLRRAHRHTPSHDNLLRLAQGLYDTGSHSDANQRFSELLADEDGDKDALFGYAQSSLALADEPAAVGAFEHLLKQQLDYRDYSVAYQLCGLYWKDDREDLCIALLERVCKKTLRLEPRIQLARYLEALERHEEARTCLEDGLDALAGSPHHSQRQQRVPAWQAKRILRGLPASSPSALA